jgi:glycerol uptake facilitator-like aquaporin
MNKYLVEFIGTLFILYVVLYTKNAFAIGAATTIALILGQEISGGHFNPSLSFMMAYANKLSAKDMLPYILVQIAGGLAAYELYKRVN